jgi:hypothetical protein
LTPFETALFKWLCKKAKVGEKINCKNLREKAKTYLTSEYVTILADTSASNPEKAMKLGPSLDAARANPNKVVRHVLEEVDRKCAPKKSSGSTRKNRKRNRSTRRR